MENASKALIMAGSVIIGIIILSLLVVFFNNLRQVKQADVSAEQIEQAAEYNKQYEVYNRSVYGSELLSIAHKVVDYNVREADAKYYEPIELEVTITNSVIIETLNETGKLSKNKNGDTFTSTELAKAISDPDGLNKTVENYGNYTIEYSKDNQRRKLKQLVNMRQNEIIELGSIKGIKDQDGNTVSESLENLKLKYSKYKSFLSEFKAKKFRLVGFEYDESTGRITKMKYRL